MFLVFFMYSCCCLGGASGSAAIYGLASYYGDEFHGRKTASGEIYNKWDLTCAHKKFKFGTRLKVTNMKNKKSVIVRVNDRGPFVKKRILDLSYAAARNIDMLSDGVVKVKIEVLDDH